MIQTGSIFLISSSDNMLLLGQNNYIIAITFLFLFVFGTLELETLSVLARNQILKAPKRRIFFLFVPRSLSD